MSWRAQASPTRPEKPSLASVGGGMAAGAAFAHLRTADELGVRRDLFAPPVTTQMSDIFTQPANCTNSGTANSSPSPHTLLALGRHTTQHDACIVSMHVEPQPRSRLTAYCTPLPAHHQRCPTALGPSRLPIPSAQWWACWPVCQSRRRWVQLGRQGCTCTSPHARWAASMGAGWHRCAPSCHARAYSVSWGAGEMGADL